MRTLTCIAMAAILSGTGCQAEPSLPSGEATSPLIGGMVETGSPAVVALTRGGSASFCSGTLVSPSVILTAAHCIDMAGADPNVAIFFGADTSGEGARIGVSAKFQHLGWTGNLDNNNDIGLLLMTFPKTDVTPIPMLTTAPAVNDNYRVVGFGVYDNANQLSDGKKRTGDVTIAQVLSPPSGDEIIISDSETIVCFGDSGGPGFVTIGETEYVAGVHSWTSGSSGSSCGAPNGDTRVDLFASTELQPWIDANDPTCGMDGYCALSGCTDDPDCTPCGPDGTCTQDCPLPDPDCPTQGIGEICQADSQCMSGLCVFWSGDPGTKFCSQPCETANDTCPSPLTCQSVMPFGNVCYYTEDPPGVLGDSCSQPTDCGSYKCADETCVESCDLTVGRGCMNGFECASRNDGADYFCWSLEEDDDDGGICSAAGGSSSSFFTILFIALLALRRRRGSSPYRQPSEAR